MVRPDLHLLHSCAGRPEPTSRDLRWLSATVLVEVPVAGSIWVLPVLSALNLEQGVAGAARPSPSYHDRVGTRDAGYVAPSVARTDHRGRGRW